MFAFALANLKLIVRNVIINVILLQPAALAKKKAEQIMISMNASAN